MPLFDVQVAEYQITYKKKSDFEYKIESQVDAISLIRPYFEEYHGIKEAFYVIYMNRANKVTGIMKISDGGISGTSVDARLILKGAIDLLASGLILVHNHPSGNLTPSQADIKITKEVHIVCKALGCNLLDHIILSENSHSSIDI